jgi:hypothetical protein
MKGRNPVAARGAGKSFGDHARPLFQFHKG